MTLNIRERKFLFKFAASEVWQSWSIAPVLKTGVPQGTGGSNPSASANELRVSEKAQFVLGFFLCNLLRFRTKAKPLSCPEKRL